MTWWPDTDTSNRCPIVACQQGYSMDAQTETCCNVFLHYFFRARGQLSVYISFWNVKHGHTLEWLTGFIVQSCEQVCGAAFGLCQPLLIPLGVVTGWKCETEACGRVPGRAAWDNTLGKYTTTCLCGSFIYVLFSLSLSFDGQSNTGAGCCGSDYGADCLWPCFLLHVVPYCIQSATVVSSVEHSVLLSMCFVSLWLVLSFAGPMWPFDGTTVSSTAFYRVKAVHHQLRMRRDP